ncbi:MULTISPECIES: hypothetical protein [unclassified Bradyrhizobium]|uniref:hypothetical protein n=1 Tax=unclassified Bradyrhizobium TaxID=2631580 RepID=UPI002915E893|nr:MULTISPECIES: hypothetical protein [unclassified Bradyrhizobium]
MMSKLDLTPEELTRFRVTFALGRLSKELQSDVLADGAIEEQIGIAVSTPINLPEDIVIDRKNLFSAFQKAADGEPIPDIVDSDGIKREIKVEVQNEMAIASYGAHRIAFPQATLLSADLERRKRALANILKTSSLTAQAREQLQSLISKPEYSHADFFAARKILGGAPEHFATALREVANKGSLSRSDFLPSETAHWENLTARQVTAHTLVEFVNSELATERGARLAEDDPKDAIDVISLTFGGPELTPLEAMRALKPDDLLTGLKHLLQFPDPFALTGAFEICADQAQSNARFVELGDEILDRLLKDAEELRNQLTTFAAAFTIATAYLAKHETLRKQPVFWRRLAAASHASLVTRVLGASSDGESSLLTWAIQLSGKTFYLSVLNDAPSEARWRPDWMSPNFLMAHLFGRLQGAVQRLGEAAPETWRKKLEDAESSVLKDAPPLARTFPSVLQGWVPLAEKPPEDTDIGQMYANFAREPTLENFLYFTPIVFAFGFAGDTREPVLKVVQALRANLATTSPEFAQAALDLAALIAAQSRDPELADAVAAVAVERVVVTRDVDRLLPAATVILQCAAACTDQSEAHSMLARRLENLAFVAPPELLPEALDTFRILQSLNEELGRRLGRANATVRLGLPRIASAY